MKAAKTLSNASSNLPALFKRLQLSFKSVPRASKGLNQHIDLVSSEIDRISNANQPVPNFEIEEITKNFFIEQNKLPDYAFMQLTAPDSESTFVSDKVRFGLSYQGPNLTYLGHYHKAKELYIVLDTNNCEWWQDSSPKWKERNYSFHEQDENHAMSTNTYNNINLGMNVGTLFFWSWTGDLTLDVKYSYEDVQKELSRENQANCVEWRFGP